MRRQIHLFIMIFIYIFVVASCASGPLLMDSIFYTEMQIESRDGSEQKFLVSMNKIHDTILAKVESQDMLPIALYKNGYLQIGNDCVDHKSSIAPMLPSKLFDTKLNLENFWTQLLLWNETIPMGVLGFDYLINQCKDKKRFVLEYEKEHFVLCVDSNKQSSSLLGATTEIISQSLYINITYAKDFIHPQLNQLTKDVDSKCKICHVSKKSPLKGIQHNLKKLWFNSPTTCHLNLIKDEKICSSVFTSYDKLDKKVCIFLHGSGEEEVSAPVTSHKSYWGKIENFTPQCKERIFIKQDTLHKGWNDKDLQASYCQVALSGQPHSEIIIKNKVIFAHSMGNLILAGAILNKICDIDINTTSWYSIQAPMKGSKAADYLDHVCLMRESTKDKAFNLIASKGGYCINNRAASVYETLSPQFPNLDKVYSIMKKRVKGALCGNSSVGLWSPYSLALKAISSIVDYEEPNDGMVGSSSCLFDGIEFSTEDYQSNFYNAEVNHSDGPCRNGDGLYSSSRKPCSWYLGKL